MDRPLCLNCKQRFRAVNCHRNGKIYYRKMCENCLKRRKKIKPTVPKWTETGYQKKPACDRCGFRSKYAAQLLVYHIDGNMNNAAPKNLRTICQNCVIEVTKLDLPWRAGDLEPDR
jgi:hypothetical protein